MEGKEKMIEIYNAMADMTLKTLNFFNESRKKNCCTVLDEEVLGMVRMTQSLYEAVNHANQTITAIPTIVDFTSKDSQMKRVGQSSFNC